MRIKILRNEQIANIAAMAIEADRRGDKARREQLFETFESQVLSFGKFEWVYKMPNGRRKKVDRLTAAEIWASSKFRSIEH